MYSAAYFNGEIVSCQRARLVRAVRARTSMIASLWTRLGLAAAYHQGRSKARVAGKERVEPEIVDLGNELRVRAVQEYHNKYTERGYRVLFHMPPQGVGIMWFSHLIQCFQHTGIACATVESQDPEFKGKWEAFRPNVFISMDTTANLSWLDLKYIERYKRDHGCIRLFTPIVPHRFPQTDLSDEDKYRLELASRGLSADMFFCMMVPDFFAEYMPQWAKSGFKYFGLPAACNPFVHYPVSAEKDLDYFYVAAAGPERCEVAKPYMTQILRNYHGLWGGAKWGFGLGRVIPEQLKDYYARCRIAPAPLLKLLTHMRGEITERTFSTTACGGFLLTNRTPVTARFFAEDELLQVDDEDEFGEAFAHYVGRPADRNAVVLRGLRRVFTEHTYFHRAEALVHVLDGNKDLF